MEPPDSPVIMRTQPLPPIRPGQLFPNRGEVNSILQLLNSLGAGGGAGIRNTPMGLSGPPQTPSWVYFEITDNDDPSLSGLHSATQITFDQLADGSWVSGSNGVVCDIAANPLKELNGRQITVGEVVRAELGPGDRCWVTTWAGEEFDTGSGSGAGGNPVTVECIDGTAVDYTISRGLDGNYTVREL